MREEVPSVWRRVGQYSVDAVRIALPGLSSVGACSLGQFVKRAFHKVWLDGQPRRFCQYPASAQLVVADGDGRRVSRVRPDFSSACESGLDTYRIDRCMNPPVEDDVLSGP